MGYIGSTYLNVVPKIEGLSSAVSKAASSAESSAKTSGDKLGNSLTGGITGSMTKAGVVAGAFSAVTTTAMNAVASSLGGAISRFDALNNYPKVMTALGYSSEEASNSINTMSDRLQGLPTALNDMTSTVQGIVAVTGDLDQATDAGLALNDMLLAGGSSAQLTTAAMEQFRQMLAKGKPEMQDWRSLTSAMPGQMKQLAEAMLGAGASADDLYAALGGGKNEAILSMDDLMNAMIRLDQEGGEGITSFAEQAKNASGGIQTSIDNIGNAMNRGIASVFDSIGKETISSTLEEVRTGIESAFKVVSQFTADIMPTVKTLTGFFKEHFAAIATGFVAYKGLSVGANVAVSAFGNIKGSMKGLAEAFKLAKGGAGTLTEAFKACGVGISPVGVAISAVTAVVGVGLAVWQDYSQRMEAAKKATTGLTDACSRSSNISSFAGTVETIGTKAGATTKTLKESHDAIAKYVDKINETNEQAESQISILNTAQGIIGEYAGKSDLSAEAQGKVKWACEKLNEQLGLNIDSTSVLNGKYTDQEGNVQDLISSLDKLIEKKKEEIQLNTYEEDLTNALQARKEAQEAYVNGIDAYNELIDKRTKQYMREGGTGGLSYEDFRANVEKAYREMNPGNVVDTLERANEAYKIAATNLGLVEQAANGVGDAYSSLSTKIGDSVAGSWLEKKNLSIQNLTDDLRTLGADTTRLATLTDDEWDIIGQAYDGTCQSIAGVLQDLNINLATTSENGSVTASQLKEAFNGLGDDITSSFQDAGIDIDDFMEKCALAGVSTETFQAYGSENLKKLADNCENDVDKMVSSLAAWNMTPFVNKDGSVNVNTESLMDSQGQVYTWNGTELINKATNAVADATSVVDATGQVWEWNGTELVNKDGWAKVTGNATDGTARVEVQDTTHSINDLPLDKNSNVNLNGNFWSAGDVLWNIVNAIRNLFDKTFNINANVSQNAAGGYRLNAAGGFTPRYHANGAIATRAVPLDIVGENGAEAIVPLTNRQYAMPFIDMLADGLMQKQDTSTLINWLSANLGTIINQNTPATVIDNDAGSLIVDNRLQQLQRKAGMNRGY